MAKKKISDIVFEVLESFLKDNSLELYNVEFKKEGKDWFLRVYIDKQPSPDSETQEYVNTDDCEMVSRFLSEKLDELDPIEQNYYLEVSSPGMDRELLKEEHYTRFAGQLVDVSLYKGVDGSKSYTGTLVGLADGKVIIKDEKDNERQFPLEDVAKTKLTVVF
ncbi:MAG TPA: ribosome maturation factor RimP [Anaerovoracaceae bacterium]|nr:ribosome maturation factor RimP [Anaerovoracaceae bacterium]